jgi:hypothetical protein
MTATKITPGLITTLVGATGLPASAGLEYISTTTASSSATVEITGMAEGYDYMVQLEEVLPATDAQTLVAVVGVGGTPTWRASATYMYQQMAIGYVSSMYGEYNAGSGSLGSYFVVGTENGAQDQGNATNEQLAGELLIRNPGRSSTATTGTFLGDYGTNGGYRILGLTGFRHVTAEAVTSIKFYYLSGNIATGTFNLYRRPNA